MGEEYKGDYHLYLKGLSRAKLEDLANQLHDDLEDALNILRLVARYIEGDDVVLPARDIITRIGGPHA